MKKMLSMFVICGMLACAPAWAKVNFNGGTKAEYKEEKPVVPEVAKKTVEQAAPLTIEEQRPAVVTPAPLKVQVKTTPASAPTPAATPSGETELSTKFKAIQTQEEWVAKLRKQLDGETSQLSAMRESLAQSFGLDQKKLEKGEYRYDAKSGKLVEK